MLKSPSTNLGRGMRARRRLLSIWFQKPGWLGRSTGAYIFKIVVFWVSDHVRVRMVARPGIRVTTLTWLGDISTLLIRKVTPVEALGLVGLYE